MDDIRQEMPNEGPILKLNKRLNKKLVPQEIYSLSGLEKINSIAFLEVKLLAEPPVTGEKLSTSE